MDLQLFMSPFIFGRNPKCCDQNISGVCVRAWALNSSPSAGRAHSADPVLPRLPQSPQPADVPEPGSALRAHQPAPPHGGGQEAQTQLLTGNHAAASSSATFSVLAASAWVRTANTMKETIKTFASLTKQTAPSS